MSENYQTQALRELRIIRWSLLFVAGAFGFTILIVLLSVLGESWTERRFTPAPSAAYSSGLLADAPAAPAPLPTFAPAVISPKPDGDTKKWAKGIASDFLDCALHGDAVAQKALAGLLTPELARQAVTDLNSPLSEWRQYQEANITSAEMAPNGGEVLVSGTLKGKGQEAGFTLRVIRESEGGRWGIRFFRLKERPARKGKDVPNIDLPPF